MSRKGVFTVEYLPDGRIKIDSDDMSGPAHRQAEEFIATVEYLAGGQVTKERKRGHHHHTHAVSRPADVEGG